MADGGGVQTMTATHVPVFLLSLSVFWNSVVSGDLGHAVVRRKAEGNGFHRSIQTDIKWYLLRNILSSTSHCKLLLVENIPQGLYVDLDESYSATAFGGPKVVSYRPFDVEKPAHQSTTNTVLVYPIEAFLDEIRGNTVQVNTSLAVHLRYHKPSQGGQAAVVHLDGPLILGHCDGQLASDGTISISAPCVPGTDLVCSWQSISVKHSMDTTDLVFEIPTGNTDHTAAVTVGTVLVTVLGTAVVLFYALQQRQKDKIS